MRSCFLLFMFSLFFFYCSLSFAQSITCSSSFLGRVSCSDGTSIHENILGGFTIYKPSSYTSQRPKHRTLTEDDISICSAETEKPEDFALCLREITTKPAYVPSVTCEQNSKNKTECFDKVTGRRWEIVP